MSIKYTLFLFFVCVVDEVDEEMVWKSLEVVWRLGVLGTRQQLATVLVSVDIEEVVPVLGS